MSSWSTPSPDTPMPPTSVCAAVDRHAAGKDLRAVRELRNGARDRETVVEAIDAGAIRQARPAASDSVKPTCWISAL